MPQSLTDVQIEFRAEMMTNHLDREYMSDKNTMEEFEYKIRIHAIDVWADEMYKIRDRKWRRYDD